MDRIIKKITEQFLKDSNVEIVVPFSRKDSFWISGKILVKYKSVKIFFETILPANYPMTQPHQDNISINFVNKELIGYSHINNDGSVCFHPDKDDNFDRKIKAELKGLQQWISDYYINGKEDERYTHLQPSIQGNTFSTLYFGENSKKFKCGDFGTFKFSRFSNQKIARDDNSHFNIETYFRVGFDINSVEDWSEDFLLYLQFNKNHVKNGLWCYIEKEPIKNIENKRILVSSWDELQSYLPQKVLKFLYNILKEKKKQFFSDEYLFFSIGYKIPNNDSYETHWQLIKIHKKEIPITGKKVSNGKYIGTCNSININWGLTKNTSYHRFFGRGKLTDSLVNARVLLIGLGAIGSSLAEILARGGLKNITINDFDIVETGNLCRANYSLFQLNLRKIDALRQRLISISPFLNTRAYNLKLNLFSKKELMQELNENFDIIFDCSTDNEISVILDNIKFKGTIFSLGLTNNATYLTCCTGGEIAKKTAILYDCLENEPASFFEGTGCGYPTFNANFNDINTVLNLSIKKINETLKTSGSIDSFHIKNITIDSHQIEIAEYVTFFQKDIKKYLLFPKGLFLKIEIGLLQHFPNEFGGIFIGHKSLKFSAVIVTDILFPDKYKNGKAEFTRHPKSLNERLETLLHESNGSVEYLGEFHSHPNASTKPSKLDIQAMTKIAKTSNVTTDNPILMIGKINKTELVESKFYIFNNNKLYEYEQRD